MDGTHSARRWPSAYSLPQASGTHPKPQSRLGRGHNNINNTSGQWLLDRPSRADAHPYQTSRPYRLGITMEYTSTGTMVSPYNSPSIVPDKRPRSPFKSYDEMESKVREILTKNAILTLHIPSGMKLPDSPPKSPDKRDRMVSFEETTRRPEPDLGKSSSSGGSTVAVYDERLASHLKADVSNAIRTTLDRFVTYPRRQYLSESPQNLTLWQQPYRQTRQTVADDLKKEIERTMIKSLGSSLRNAPSLDDSPSGQQKDTESLFEMARPLPGVLAPITYPSGYIENLSATVRNERKPMGAPPVSFSSSESSLFRAIGRRTARRESANGTTDRTKDPHDDLPEPRASSTSEAHLNATSRRQGAQSIVANNTDNRASITQGTGDPENCTSEPKLPDSVSTKLLDKQRSPKADPKERETAGPQQHATSWPKLLLLPASYLPSTKIETISSSEEASQPIRKATGCSTNDKYGSSTPARLLAKPRADALRQEQKELGRAASIYLDRPKTMPVQLQAYPSIVHNFVDRPISAAESLSRKDGTSKDKLLAISPSSNTTSSLIPTKTLGNNTATVYEPFMQPASRVHTGIDPTLLYNHSTSSNDDYTSQYIPPTEVTDPQQSIYTSIRPSPSTRSGYRPASDTDHLPPTLSKAHPELLPEIKDFIRDSAESNIYLLKDFEDWYNQRCRSLQTLKVDREVARVPVLATDESSGKSAEEGEDAVCNASHSDGNSKGGDDDDDGRCRSDGGPDVYRRPYYPVPHHLEFDSPKTGYRGRHRDLKGASNGMNSGHCRCLALGRPCGSRCADWLASNLGATRVGGAQTQGSRAPVPRADGSQDVVGGQRPYVQEMRRRRFGSQTQLPSGCRCADCDAARFDLAAMRLDGARVDGLRVDGWDQVDRASHADQSGDGDGSTSPCSEEDYELVH